MILSGFILLLAALVPGLAILLGKSKFFDKPARLLSFGGSFLFSITVIHLLPEIFHESPDPFGTGMWVLGGFFLQMVLVLFTTGVEHGHMHKHHHHDTHGEHHPFSPVLLMVSLSLHAFMEGAVLIHPGGHHHEHGEVQSLLSGIVIHKITETIALVSVLSFHLNSKRKALLMLIGFALASPLGLLAGHEVMEYDLANGEGLFRNLSALVAGNFLHISTTIFFESQPAHKLSKQRFFTAGAGALAALASEWLMH